MEYGIVRYLPDAEGHLCGYCKSQNSRFRKGMRAYSLPVQIYQDLIDRGWQRSGKHCYKPEMNKTCCPSYTISSTGFNRCDALSFKPTKSHKKILKRVHKFLLNGRQDSDAAADKTPKDEDDGACQAACQMNEADICLNVANRFEERMSCDIVGVLNPKTLPSKDDKAEARGDSAANKSSDKAQKSESSSRCREEMPAHHVFTTKKKALRKQRWLEKQKAKDQPVNPPAPKNSERSLEDWLNLPRGKHNLEIRLVRTTPYSEEAERTTDSSHLVYKRYLMKVHGASQEKCGPSNWKKFVVESPILAEEDPLLGSFHQQYWLDDRLIAVGVVDLLPYCISSVYFYYDPEFEFLSMGTFASLCEIKLTRELQKKLPSMKYYYMGGYIHSCPKMRYKGRLPNSDLLCPEAYTWHPIQECVPLLDASEYSRLEPDGTLSDPEAPATSDVFRALLLHKRHGITLAKLLREKNMPRETVAGIKEYSELVGSKIMRELYLYVK